MYVFLGSKPIAASMQILGVNISALQFAGFTENGHQVSTREAIHFRVIATPPVLDIPGCSINTAQCRQSKSAS